MGIERATAETSMRHSLLGRSITRQAPLAILLLLLLVGCTSVGRVDGSPSQSAGIASAKCPSGDGAMRPEENKRIVRRLHDEVWTRGKLETVEEVIAPNFVGRVDRWLACARRGRSTQTLGNDSCGDPGAELLSSRPLSDR